MNLPGRPPPTTFESIEAIALREPGRLALVQDDRSWTYQAIHADLVRVIRVLHELGVKRGDRVAVGTEGLQASLLLLIAAESLGAATTCFLPEGDPDAQALFELVDWVISDAPQQVPARARGVTLDAAFIRRVQSVDASDPAPLPCVALELHEPMRISRTSGSSGRSKFMLLSRYAQEGWIRMGCENGGYRPDSRVLFAGPPVMNVMVTRSSGCLRMGAAVFDLARTGLAGHELTHILALPTLLEEILKFLPPGYAPRGRIDVQSMGGFVSAHLRERVMKVFGGRIASRYGANETAGICDDLDADGVGIVSPGVDLKITDEEGRELPQGSLGVIAVRTQSMVEGYIGDEEATKRSFRDGWFVSGDWGTLIAPRVLRLAGRYDDLLVVGGLKVPANEIEAQVRGLVNASECAAFALNLEGGTITMGIALVLPAGADRAKARQDIEQGLKKGIGTNARILFLDAVPRMGNGKVDRVTLHALFASPPPGSL